MEEKVRATYLSLLEDTRYQDLKLGNLVLNEHRLNNMLHRITFVICINGRDYIEKENDRYDH